jgi:hypothetical protein
MQRCPYFLVAIVVALGIAGSSAKAELFFPMISPMPTVT